MDGEAGSPAPDTARPVPVRSGRIGLWLTAGIGACLTLTYRIQPDPLAAITVIPAWCWLVPWLALLLRSRHQRRGWPWRSLLLMGCLFATLCVEQTRSVPRGLWIRIQDAQDSESRLRVVSLNCHVGTPQVVDDLARLKPDLVFLQESPTAGALRSIAARLFGDDGQFVSTGDCSIIAAGELEMISVAFQARFVLARWRPRDGEELIVVSLRLPPPSTRLDLWRLDCWRTHQQRRERHRAQLLELTETLSEIPVGTPLIVGGDLNSPAGDGAHSVLRDRLRDSFETAGCGWGCTFSNDTPFHRIDQIWLSPDLTPRQVTADAVTHSDHRAAVCNIEQSRDAKLEQAPLAPAE
jgi:vancomycin resistance protein VanJ